MRTRPEADERCKSFDRERVGAEVVEDRGGEKVSSPKNVLSWPSNQAAAVGVQEREDLAVAGQVEERAEPRDFNVTWTNTPLAATATAVTATRRSRRHTSAAQTTTAVTAPRPTDTRVSTVSAAAAPASNATRRDGARSRSIDANKGGEDEHERPQFGFVVDVCFGGQRKRRRARDCCDQERRSPRSASGRPDECADASGEVEDHRAHHHESDDHRQAGDSSLRPRTEQCNRKPGDGQHRPVVEIGLAVDEEPSRCRQRRLARRASSGGMLGPGRRRSCPRSRHDRTVAMASTRTGSVRTGWRRRL